MQKRLRKPLNVGDWGKQLVWELPVIPQILAGFEPDHEPSLYPSPQVNQIADALMAAVMVGRLKPEKVLGNRFFFLAGDVLNWANSLGFKTSLELVEAVFETSKDYFEHLKAQVAANEQKAGDAIARAQQTSRDVRRLDEVTSTPPQASPPAEAKPAAAPIPAAESLGQVQGFPQGFRRGDALRYELLELVREARKENAEPNAAEIIRRIRPTQAIGGVIVGLKEDGLYYLKYQGADAPEILDRKQLAKKIRLILKAH